jgi:hypothetical protein
MYLSDSKPSRKLHFVAGTGGSVAGAFMILSGTTAVLGSDGTVGAATALGVADNTVAENGIVDIESIKGRQVTAPFTGAVTFTDADLGKVYDLDAGGLVIDATDTTGGFAVLQGYDNTAKTVTFIVPDALVYC